MKRTFLKFISVLFKTTFWVVCALFLISMSSCSNDDDEKERKPEFKEMFVDKVSRYSEGALLDTYQYDLLGRITEVSHAEGGFDYNMKITYGTDEIKVVWQAEGGQPQVHIFLLNDKGLITSCKQTSSYGLKKVTYQYDEQDQMVHVEQEFSWETRTFDIKWENGNIVSIKDSDFSKESYYVYNDKKYNGNLALYLCNPFLQEILHSPQYSVILTAFGYFGKQCRNLVEKCGTSLVTIECEYVFNEDGNLEEIKNTSQNAGGGSPDIYKYEISYRASSIDTQNAGY